MHLYGKTLNENGECLDKHAIGKIRNVTFFPENTF